jgi:hypothetical protein
MGKRKCKFKNDLKSKYLCFRNGRDEWEAECVVCKPGTYVSVAHRGALDLRAHVECERHKEALKAETSSPKEQVFMKSGSKSDDAVLAAEGAFAFHTVKHHSSYKTADCTYVLFKTIFPDSEVARKFSSARTKTEAIINSVIAPHAIKNIKQVFTNNTI